MGEVNGLMDLAEEELATAQIFDAGKYRASITQFLLCNV